MPIPLVFGTEHELVTHLNMQSANPGKKLWAEAVLAMDLLEHLRRCFFPEITEWSNAGNRAGAGQPDIYVAGYMTPLGSRFYIDHGYFELSSPECDDPFVQLACQIAQEELIAEEFEKLFGDDPRKPRLYKNVSDGKGHSQAAHRNFCMSIGGWRRITSQVCWPLGIGRETRMLATWHVIEQILTGAGKYGDEHALIREPYLTTEEITALKNVFLLSCRADFVEELLGDRTVCDRPIINCRDEPLADPGKYGRYHCICGDANRAEWPHLFKMALTALVLGMIEDDAFGLDFYVADPVAAIREVSKDPTCRKPIGVKTFSGGQIFGLAPFAIMKVVLSEMEKYLASRSVPEWCLKIHDKAVWAVRALENEPRLLERVLDWKIKERLETIGRGRQNAFLRHLEYHAMTGPAYLYRTLCENEEIETVIPRDMIRRYKTAPPETTRAYFRGRFIQHFYRNIDFFASNWRQIAFYSEDGGRMSQNIIRMPEPLALTKKLLGNIFEGERPAALGSFKNVFASGVYDGKMEDD